MLRSLSRKVTANFHSGSTFLSSSSSKKLHLSNQYLQYVHFSTRLRERPPPIQLTENAARRIKELLESKDDVVGVKISVRRRGCNGYSYTMNYANAQEAATTKDEVVTAHGVKVFVDPKAIFFIVGTVMDFEETELSSEFTFKNPNSKGECGCGESFNI